MSNNLDGVIIYTMPDGFEMVEEFGGDGAVLEECVKELRANGCTCISIRFYDREEE